MELRRSQSSTKSQKKTVLFVLLSPLLAIHNLICSFTSKQLRVFIKRLFSFNQLQTGEEQYHR